MTMPQAEPVTSWPSRALPWLVPSLLLNAPLGRPVILVSPWVEDVTLCVPACHGRDGRLLHGNIRLAAFLIWLAENHSKRVVLYVREDQIVPTANYRLVPILRTLSHVLLVHGVDHLHGKMVVTDTVILETSANLLTASLHRNVETASTRRNIDSDAVRFVRSYLRSNNAIVSSPTSLGGI